VNEQAMQAGEGSKKGEVQNRLTMSPIGTGLASSCWEDEVEKEEI
jgi:hypothetical protein